VEISASLSVWRTAAAAMLGRSLGAGVAAALLMLIVLPEARAETCGETPPGATKPARAKLALDTEKSKTTVSFGKSTDPKNMSLIFKASGCDLPDSPPDPTLTPVALKGSDDIPDGALRVRDTTADTDNNVLILRVQALPKTLDPGTYSSLVFAKAPYLATNSTTITLSRSEHDWWWLLLIGLAGAGAGVGVAVGVSYASKKLALSGTRLVIVVALMLGSGAYAALSNWWTQDVWTFSANLKGLVVAAFVAATTGTFAGLIGGGSAGNGNGGGGGGT
jgi:hypothetical protein